MSKRHRMWVILNAATILLGVGVATDSPVALAASLPVYVVGLAHLRGVRLTARPGRIALIIFWWLFALQVGGYAALGDAGGAVGAGIAAAICMWVLLRDKGDQPIEIAPFQRPQTGKGWLKLAAQCLAVGAVYMGALLLLLYVLFGVSYTEGSAYAMFAVGVILAFHIPVGYLVRSRLVLALPWLPVFAGLVTTSDVWEDAYWFAALIGITPFGLIGIALGRRLDGRIGRGRRDSGLDSGEAVLPTA